MIEIVKNAEHSTKLSKRSKAKARKVQLIFQEQQQQQRKRQHDEQRLKELQKQAVANIKNAAIADERLYFQKRNNRRRIQILLDMTETEISNTYTCTHLLHQY